MLTLAGFRSFYRSASSLCWIAPLGIAVALVAGETGCGSETPEDLRNATVEGTDMRYVVSDVILPSGEQLNAFMLDVDGDGFSRADGDSGSDARERNSIGAALSAASAIGLEVADQVSTAFKVGGAILLVNVRTTDLTNASDAGVWMFLGANPDPAPCTDPEDATTCGQHLQGTGKFQVGTDSPVDGLLKGSIQDGQFDGGPGKITLQLSLSDAGEILNIPLTSAMVRMEASKDEIANGILSGGITEENMDNIVLPGVVGLINEVIDESCDINGDPAANCGCPEGEQNRSVSTLNFLRESENGVRPSCSVDVAILKASPIGTAFSPDIDLLDAEGNLTEDGRPNPDGLDDSVSIGLGFTAVTGAFELPDSADNQE